MKNIRNDQLSIFKIASIILFTLGSFPFLYFLRFVDVGVSFNLFLAGVCLVSLGTVLAILTVNSSSSNIHFIVILYFQTLLLFVMFIIRFDSFGGDCLWEYRTARNTLEQGKWLLVRSQWERYFSSISISLTPPIVSEITGLDLLFLFKYGFRVITAILPVILFRTVDEIFKKPKLAAIAAVLFSQLYFNILKFQSHIRQQTAEIFLVLTLFILIKQYKSKKNYKSYVPLIFIFMTMTVFSHYTINYFSFPIFVAILLFTLLLSYLPQKLLMLFHVSRSSFVLHHKKAIVNHYILVLFIVFSLMWWSTANLTNFMGDYTHEANVILGKAGLRTHHYEVQFIGGSPLGPIVTAWIDLGAVLAGVGAIYLIFRFRKEKSEQIAWISAALVLMALMSLWLFPQHSAAGVYIDRVYIIGSIFFTSCSGYLLLLLYEHRFKFLKILFISFMLLNLPMNMFLPAHSGYVHYHKESDVPSELVLLRGATRDAEFVMQSWIDVYARNSKFLVYDPGGAFNTFLIHGSFHGSSIPSSNQTDYTILDHLTLLQGLWRTGELSYDIINVSETINQSCVIYNNGRSAVISTNYK